MKTCFVTWNRTWAVNCTVVKDAIIVQIKKWTSADNCKDGGEKCLYMVCQTSTVAWQISYFHAQNTRKLFIIRLLRPWMQGKKMSDMVGGEFFSRLVQKCTQLCACQPQWASKSVPLSVFSCSTGKSFSNLHLWASLIIMWLIAALSGIELSLFSALYRLIE